MTLAKIISMVDEETQSVRFRNQNGMDVGSRGNGCRRNFKQVRRK